jgi:menaquinone-dependent protoporphyrinogen oxidase
MRVLVTWGSKRGGTARIGTMIADTLAASGYEVMAAPIERVTSLDGFNGVIIGGALYANLWPSKARRFVNRHYAALRKLPVWMFSSGPLDISADEKDIPPTRVVSILAERVGAQGHVTFGGRLDPAARGSRRAPWQRHTVATGAVPIAFTRGPRTSLPPFRTPGRGRQWSGRRGP